jgi:hypothetical protein
LCNFYPVTIFLERFVLEAIPTQHAHQDGFAGGLATHGGEGEGLDLQMPISIHLDHLHSVYIAAGTLACALVIVLVTVSLLRTHIYFFHNLYVKSLFMASNNQYLI